MHLRLFPVCMYVHSESMPLQSLILLNLVIVYFYTIDRGNVNVHLSAIALQTVPGALEAGARAGAATRGGREG